MDAQPTSLITRMFDDIEQLDDPRADNARHFLTDILMIAILGVMSGVDDYPGIVEFGHDRLELLKTFLRLPHGIPSVSTFRRVFASLKPSALGEALARWSGNLAGSLAGKQIAIDGGHGRIDTRRIWATDQIQWLEGRKEWKALTTVITVESIRRVSGKIEPSVERRHYLASVPCNSGQRLAGLVRNHWSTENQQHWVLDTAFNEDQSRIRKDHGDQNMAIMRRLALGLLRRDKSVKVGAKNKRLKAGRNPDYLFKVLLSPAMAK